ncbi:MAG TPA: hypothetical protein DCQ06_00880, partial [Myxococcales bacterium]|nr:hypothetical protein [Myxococcales bacterium]
GLVVMLPTNDAQKALAAFSAAKRGAEAKGHAASLAIGVRTVYFDVVPGYLVVSDRPARFGKIQGFAKRLASFKPPSLVYLGVAMSELAKTQQLLLSMFMAQFEKQVGKDKGVDGQSIKRWLTELDRVEVTVDASRDFVTFGSRVTPKPGTALAKQFNRGRGHDASSMAGILPGNSLMTVLSSQKAEADDTQFKLGFEAFLAELEIDAAHRPTLEKDMKTLTSLQDGSVLATLYPDGKSGLGFASAVGSRDPKAFVSALYRLASHVLVGLADVDPKKASAEENKAIAALKKQQIQALLDLYGAEMKKDGVTVRLNHNTSDGVSCDVIDFEFDAKKLPQDDFAKGLVQAMGSKTSAVCCAGAKRVVVALGASALEQGRRIAAGKPGGLASAPVFKATLARAPSSPTMFMYANVGALLRNMQSLLPKPISLPTDRALGAGCGYRSRSFSCKLDVPISLIELISTEMRQK